MKGGWSEFFEDFDKSSLWIVDHKGRLEVLVCPFSVRVVHSVGDLKRGDQAIVDAIKVTRQLKTVFIIEDRAYLYRYFDFEQQK